MLLNHCSNCHAPDGERVFRHKDGFAWSQNWKEICNSLEWENKATMIRLMPDTGLCEKCNYKAKKGWPVKP